MNEIKIKVDFTKGTISREGINVVSGDYKSTKLKFTFDADYSSNTLIFEMKKPNGDLAFVSQIPSSNEIVLVALNDDEEECSIFGSAGRYTYEVSLYKDGGKLTSAADSFIVTQEEVVIDDEVVEVYLPLFDDLMTEVENINITASRVSGGVDITITDRDGTATTYHTYDGDDGADGEDGVSVTNATINSSGHLIITLSSGATIDTGIAKGEKGDTGDDGQDGDLIEVGSTTPTNPQVKAWVDTSGTNDGYLVISGGTTNQVLAKNSNTNGDFKWITTYTKAEIDEKIGNIETLLEALL